MQVLKIDDKTLEEAERFLSKQSLVEYLYIFDDLGNQKVKLKGEYEQIEIPITLLHLLPNAIITHNHPQGSSFSWEDVRTTIRHNAKEIRAVTEIGIFSLKRPNNGWDLNLDNQETILLFEETKSIIEDGVDKELLQGKITMDYVKSNFDHLVWSAFFRNFDCRYEKKNFK